MNELIRILIADDHVVVRRGLQAMLVPDHGMKVVGEATNGHDAVDMARALQPDVILMDLLMPEKDGLQAIVEIMAEDPGAHILVLTSFGEGEKVSAAIKAGALGYLLKDSTTEELLQAIRSVHVGQMSLPQSLALQMLQAPQSSGPGVSHKTLTDREVEVLLAVARGLSNQEIAQILSISPTTVRSHVSALLSKLQLSNRTQLAVYAVERGLV